MSTTVHIGGVPLGDDHPCALMAEIGTFFNQDVDLGCRFLESAAEAGVPLLKGEILHNADVCLRNSGLEHRFQHAHGAEVENYRRLIERKVVPLADYQRLLACAKRLGVPFVASVYDFEGVDFFAGEGGAAIKIARHNITNFPLIAHSAKTGLPLVFDAGLVYLDELARAVRCAREHGNGGVVVNYHPGANPAPPERHNLRLIQTYKSALDLPVGFTCHYRGAEMLYAAIGAGACLLEKGVVDDPDRVEQDLVSALRLGEIKSVLANVQACSRALGSPHATPPEPRDLNTRKGLAARRDLAAGETLSLENVLFAWPPLGVPVEHWETVREHKTARAVQAGEPIRWHDLAFD